MEENITKNWVRSAGLGPDCSSKQGSQKRPLCKESTLSKYLKEMRREEAMLTNPAAEFVGSSVK